MTGKCISITDNQLIGSETEDWVKVKKMHNERMDVERINLDKNYNQKWEGTQEGKYSRGEK